MFSTFFTFPQCFPHCHLCSYLESVTNMLPPYLNFQQPISDLFLSHFSLTVTPTFTGPILEFPSNCPTTSSLAPHIGFLTAVSSWLTLLHTVSVPFPISLASLGMPSYTLQLVKSTSLLSHSHTCRGNHIWGREQNRTRLNIGVWVIGVPYCLASALFLISGCIDTPGQNSFLLSELWYPYFGNGLHFCLLSLNCLLLSLSFHFWLDYRPN